MPRVRRAAGPLALLLTAVCVAMGVVALAQVSSPAPATTPAPSIVAATGIVSTPLRQLAAGAHAEEVGGPDEGEGDGEGDEEQGPPLPGTPGVDPVVQHASAGGPQAPAAPVPAPTISWAGLGAGFTGPAGTMSVAVWPADTTIGVGMDQVVEAVNFRMAVFSKATGAVLLGPVSPRTLFSGFGGLCQTAEDGDPIVLYDRAADRWVVSWFAGYGVSNGTSVPYLECVAVSTTADATGAWARYAFGYSMLNDYPKLSVWRDSYVATFNMFDANAGYAYIDPKVCAYDRASMLAGQPARAQQCFTPPARPAAQGGSYFSLLPASVDSFDQPPAGAPVPIVSLADFGNLATWKLSVDWATPANSSLSGVTLVPVATFANACSGGACVPQPGTTKLLASMGGRVLQRLAYRIDGGVERMTLTHGVGSASTAQVRWYELGVGSGTRAVSVVDQGTYAPDATNRWMGSSAYDWAGNLAVGYNAASGSVYPSLGVAGRLAGDPKDGTLSQSERVAYAGAGSQTGSDRWGDYTTMALDPADDCTFWFAGQYYPATHSYNWRTRIVAFAYPSCTPSRLVKLSISGNAAGSVTSDVAGMSCAASCAQVWPSGTTVVLTAHPAPGATFDGWTGACSGTATCSLTLSAATTGVGALFNDHTPPEGTVARPAAATNAATLTFALSFTEAVAGVEATDLTPGGTAAGCVIGTPVGSGAAWTVDVTGCGEGTVSLTLNQASVPDLVGNLGPTIAATSGEVLVDRTAPTVTTAPTATLRAGVSLPSAATTSAVPLTVTWEATDAGAGVDHAVLERSLNGGVWGVVSSSVAGSSAAVTAAPSGTVAYQVTVVDTAGNASAPVAGVAVAPRLVQQSSTSVKYAGSWATMTSTSRSGKTDKWSRTKYASATFTITARSVALVALRATGRGTARIYVGGSLVATVNLYRSATQARYVAWEKDWGVVAKRVVKVVVIPTAKGARVDIDGFVVLR